MIEEFYDPIILFLLRKILKLHMHEILAHFLEPEAISSNISSVAMIRTDKIIEIINRIKK